MLFLLFGAPLENGQGMQAQMNGTGLAHRRVAKLQPLRDDAQRDVVHACAAVAHRQADAHEAQFSHLGYQLDRISVIAIVFLDDRHDFLASEVIDRLLDHFMRFV